MYEKKSKPMYVGSEKGAPIPAWWLGVIAAIVFTLCSLSAIWFILVYLP